MEVWAILEFAFALVAVIACFALTIDKLHAIERAEREAWLSELKKRMSVTN